MQPALTADEWTSGIDRNPNLISFKDGHHVATGVTSPSSPTSSAEKYNKYEQTCHILASRSSQKGIFADL